MIDAHCHLEYERFDEDREEVIQRTKKELKAIVTSVAEPKYTEKALEISEKHRGFIFLCLGFHPECLKDFTEKQIEEYMQLIKNLKDKVVGIGEIGLDYYWIKDSKTREETKEVFKQFLELAKELKKPVVIHSRDAEKDCLKILEDFPGKILLHCYSGPPEIPRNLPDNYFVSIPPIIVRSRKHSLLAELTPLEKILLETDSPWLSPTKGRNEPLNIKITAEKIAGIKKIPFEKIWKQMGDNAIKFFDLTKALNL
jgi:TatD DNase family protein